MVFKGLFYVVDYENLSCQEGDRQGALQGVEGDIFVPRN